MTSEIENIEKGIVVSTIEFDANKRIIGIGTPTITPNPTTGIAPLSKQTAFVPEVKENLAQVAEKVLGTNPNQAAPIQEPIATQAAPVIPTPTVSDSISNQAVNVEIPTDLGNLSTIKEVTEPIKNSINEMAKPISQVPVEPKIETPEIVVPVTEPIATPQDVLATEPTGINEQLFATEPVQPTQVVPIQEPTETVTPVTPTTIPVEPINSLASTTVEQSVPAPLSFEPRQEIKPEEPKMKEPITETNIPLETQIVQQPMPEQQVTNAKPAVLAMTEIEKQEMAKKLANIVSSVISSKISEIAYIASYEEFLGLLNEMSKNNSLENENNETIGSNIDNAQALVNPMLIQEQEPVMKLAA